MCCSPVPTDRSGSGSSSRSAAQTRWPITRSSRSRTCSSRGPRRTCSCRWSARSLLPTHSPQRIAALNQKPFDELLNGHHFDPGQEIERAIAITRTMAVDPHHRIHFAANLFEVMVNVNAWNDAIGTPAGRAAWGQRTVTYFVHDPRSGLFAPSKYCAFVPVQDVVATSRPVIAMDMETYASLDESESRFDGNVARRHLAGRLFKSPWAQRLASTRRKRTARQASPGKRPC